MPRKDDDWFSQAAKQASSTEQARATRRASAEREMQAAKELREARVAAIGRISRRPSPEARAAAAEFGETMKPKLITPEQALGIIERVVSSSEDPVAAAGEWITKITNSLSAIAREHHEVQ